MKPERSEGYIRYQHERSCRVGRPVATGGGGGGGGSVPLEKFEPPPKLPVPFAVTIGVEVYPPPPPEFCQPPPLLTIPGYGAEGRAGSLAYIGLYRSNVTR